MNDGGPAFPCPVGHIECHHPVGMTLRDYFAAKAMAAQLTNSDMIEAVNHLEEEGETSGELLIARASYQYADAMLKAREAK